MGDSRFLVKATLDQSLVGEAGDELCGGEVIKGDLIAPGGSGVVAVAREGGGVDGGETGGQGLPLDETLLLARVMRAFIDPLLEQSELTAGQGHRADLVVFRWHLGIQLSCGGLVQDAFGAIARDDGGAGVATFEHEFHSLHVQPAFRGGLVVAGQTVVLQQGEQLLFIVHGGGGQRKG